jgi:hypothetical protein
MHSPFLLYFLTASANVRPDVQMHTDDKTGCAALLGILVSHTGLSQFTWDDRVSAREWKRNVCVFFFARRFEMNSHGIV